MKLVDELFEMYRDRLTGDEEDLDIITFSVLEQTNRKELLNIVNDMSDHELHFFIRLYLIEMLKGKMAQLEGRDPFGDQIHKNLH